MGNLIFMTTHFITAEIDLQESPVKLQQEIKAELEKQGIKDFAIK